MPSTSNELSLKRLQTIKKKKRNDKLEADLNRKRFNTKVLNE